MTLSLDLTDALDAALAYAARGWPVFPVHTSKRPLTAHGLRDATTDPAVIVEWWRRYPGALVSIATGQPSKVVALDIDIDPATGLNGYDSLEEQGLLPLPETPHAHTPRGGVHVLFAWPCYHVKTIAGQLGPGLDRRGDGGSLILSPRPGGYWDPHLGLDVPLVRAPEWLAPLPAPQQPAPKRYQPPSGPQRGLSRYGEAALDDARRLVMQAPHGAQEITLARECYGIGRLVGADHIPAGLAYRALLDAALGMPSYDSRRPWLHAELERKVQHALEAGQRKPREAA